MATQVFLHDTAATTHRGQNTVNLNLVSFIWLPKATGTVRGSGVVSKVTNTTAGPITGVEVTNTAGGTRLEWLTPPVDQDVTIAGTITGNIWANESSNSANTAINFCVDKVAATDMALTRIVTSARTTELSTSNAAVNFTATPTSTVVNKGDRLRIRIFGDDAGTMGTGFTFTTALAGTTAAASGDTYLSFTETFGFQTDLTTLISQTTGTTGEFLYGGSGTFEKLAQSFTLGSGATLVAADLQLIKASSPTDNVTLDVVSTLDGSSLATATIAASGVSTTAGDYRFTFTTPATLTAGTYYLQLSRSGTRDTTNRVEWKGDGSFGNPYAGGASTTKNSGSWGASSFYADARFTIYTNAITGSTIYLTDTTSDVATADVDREAWTARGAGVQNDVTNTQTGFITPPAQVTDTAGGTAVSWFSKPLTAFTLSGLVKVNRRALESNAAANASIGAEIARVDNDGTNATVWGYANRDADVTSGLAGEIALTETAYTCYVSGDDLAFTDGQRIRIRFFNDDCANGAQVTGHTITSYYGGTSGGASGDTYLTFSQTLTEFSAGTNNTVTHTAPNLAFAGGTALKAIRRSHTGANLQLVGGTHTAVKTVPGVNNTVTHVGPNLQLIGGTHLKSTGRKVAQVAPNFALAGGVHLKSTGRKVVHVGPNFALLGGTHALIKTRRPVHVGPNLQLVGGTHLVSKAKIVVQVAPNLQLAGGTHLKSLQRSHTAPNLAFAGGTHTPLKAKVVPHAAANLQLAGGTHLLRFDRRPQHVAPNLAFLGGTHVRTMARRIAHAGANLQLIGGTHTALKAKVVFQTAPNLQLQGGTHIRALRRSHTAPNLQFAGGTHTPNKTTGTINYTATHVAPNFALLGGTHLTSTGRKVAQVAPNLALAGGTHLRTLNRRPQHTAPNLQFAAGNHAALTGEIVGHTSPNLAFAAGTAALTTRRSHVAPNLAFAGGTHTARKGKNVTHVAPTITLQAGTHIRRTGRSHVAPNLQLQGGTHAASKAKFVVHTAANLQLAAGVQARRILKAHTAPNLQLQAGTHVASATYLIDTRWTIELDARWQPIIEIGGRHAPTVANRGAHRPTVLGRGVYEPTLTKAGALTP